MVTLFFSPAWWKHKPRDARFTGNLICGAAILTANHLDLFVKDYVAPTLGAIDLDLHDLNSHVSRVVPITRLFFERTPMEYWSYGVMGLKIQTRYHVFAVLHCSTTPLLRQSAA